MLPENFSWFKYVNQLRISKNHSLRFTNSYFHLAKWEITCMNHRYTKYLKYASQWRVGGDLDYGKKHTFSQILNFKINEKNKCALEIWKFNIHWGLCFNKKIYVLFPWKHKSHTIFKCVMIVCLFVLRLVEDVLLILIHHQL